MLFHFSCSSSWNGPNKWPHFRIAARRQYEGKHADDLLSLTLLIARTIPLQYCCCPFSGCGFCLTQPHLISSAGNHRHHLDGGRKLVIIIAAV